jgi:hypothetical protein
MEAYRCVWYLHVEQVLSILPNPLSGHLLWVLIGVVLDDLAAQETQRKDACHWMVDEVGLEAVNVQTDSMLLPWCLVCGVLGVDGAFTMIGAGIVGGGGIGGMSAGL